MRHLEESIIVDVSDELKRLSERENGSALFVVGRVPTTEDHDRNDLT